MQTVCTITQINGTTHRAILAGIAADMASAIEEVLYHTEGIITSAKNIHQYANGTVDVIAFSSDTGTVYVYTIRPTTLIQHTPKGGK